MTKLLRTTKLWSWVLIAIAGYYYIVEDSSLIVMFLVDNFGVSNAIDETSVRGCKSDFGPA